MFCPNCRSEFRRGITECSECGVRLVDEPPPEPVPEYADLHTVMVAPSEMTLMVAKSRLEAEDIPCFTKNDIVQDLFGLGRVVGFNPVTGPQDLQVSAENFERAKKILDSIEEGGSGEE